MIWLASCAAAVVAVAVLLSVVPKVRIDDEEAPDFGRLATARGAAAVALTAGLAALATLLATQVTQWWLWWPYLAFGAPLAYVDLRTTWLPKRLHWLAAGALVVGGVALAVADWRAAVAAGLGSVAAGVFFFLAWRFTRGLGFGDVRLAFLVGAVAGLGGVMGWVTAILIGTILGALHGVGYALWARRRADAPAHFAYGPALWLGPIVAAALVW